MDTKKLRQKILDLAIHGKLVPQDPNDEPASVLLERIRAEKEQLIKEGKIKKSRKTSSSSDMPHYENVPFEIPSSWEWTTLGEVFTLQAGKNITAKDISDKEDSEHRFPCYGGNGLRGFVSSYNRNGRFPLIGRQGALCGNINFAEGLFYATEHAVVVETYCKTDVEWAVHSLIHLNLNQYATSTAQPGLSVSTINEVLIPLPPIEEQGRIVRCLNKWNTLIGQIEQGKVDLQTTIKQTKSKILDLAIHGKLVPQDPNDEPALNLLKRINPDFTPCDNAQYGKLPDRWCLTKLGAIGRWQSGGTPSRANPEYYVGDIPWLKIADLQDGYVKEYSEKISNEAICNSSAKINPEGSIALAMYGSIGKLGILTFPAATNQAICVCSSFMGVDAKYLFFFLMSQRDDFVLKAGGGVQANISKEIIINHRIAIPPLPEQLRIVSKIENLFSLLNNIESSLQA